MTGGDSSDREYAPHMYVLVQGGDFRNDADYEFVGDAVASAYDEEEQKDYRMGVTVLGEIVCDVSVQDPELACEVPTGIPFEAIPETIKRELLSESLSQVATTSGHIMLHALGVSVPKDVEPLNVEKILDGTPEEQAAEQVKIELWNVVEQQMRQSLGFE